MSENTPAPQTSVPPQGKPANVPGLIAMILAIVAFIFAVIPGVSFIAWLPGLAAIVLGIVGLVIKNRPRAFAGIGLGVGILAIIVGIIVSIVTALGVVASGVSNAIEEDEQAASEIVELTFEVTGSSVANIDYSYSVDGKDTGEKADDVALPFTVTVDVPRGGTFDMNYFSLSATTGADQADVACKITLDGQVLSEESASGTFNLVICSGFSSELDD